MHLIESGIGKVGPRKKKEKKELTGKLGFLRSNLIQEKPRWKTFHEKRVYVRFSSYNDVQHISIS